MRMEFVLVGVLVHLYNTINTNTGFLYYSAYLRSQMQSCFKGKLISLTSLSWKKPFTGQVFLHTGHIPQVTVALVYNQEG